MLTRGIPGLRPEVFKCSMQIIPGPSSWPHRALRADCYRQIVIDCHAVHPGKIMQVVMGCADRPGKIIPSISGSSSRADCVDHHRHIVQICRPGSSNSFAPVSAPQGLQEAHSLHLLVPGAGVVGGTSQPIKILHLGVPTNLLIHLLH